MPYKVPQNRTKDIQRLTQLLRVKQQQLSRLEADYHQLSHRQYLLSAVCDVLQLLATLKESANATAGGSQQAAIAPEGELLQQLRGLQQQQSPLLNYQSLGSNSSGEISASLQHLGSLTSATSAFSSSSSKLEISNLQHLEERETLGTFEDPLRTLRTALLKEDQNPYPGIQELTVEQMQAEYQSMIHQLALNVGFLDNPVIRSKDNDQNPYTIIKRLVSSHSAQLTALLLRGRGYMIPQFFLSDVVTGQQLEEHDPAVYDHAAQRLDLTPVQRQLITATLRVFRSLLGGVVERRTNVQTMLALYTCGTGNRAAADGRGVSLVPAQCNTSSSDSRCRSSSSSGAATAQGSIGSRSQSPESVSKIMLSHQQQQMLEEQQQQQQDLADVVKLMQKESLLKACCWTSIEGCLTWTQLAKLLIACYPHRASPLAFAQAVERQALQDPGTGGGEVQLYSE